MKKSKFSPMLIIFITVFIDLLGFGIILPLSPYYTEHLGGTAFQVGLLSASYSLMQFIFSPFWGRLSDKYGRRPILLMSNLGNAISFFIFASADSLPILFLARILQGSFSANISTAQAYIADITETKDRSKSMGMIGAAFGLGFIFGPAIGAVLTGYGPAVGAAFGYHAHGIFGMGFPAFVAGLVCLSNFILSVFILPESLKKENRRSLTAPKGVSRLKIMTRIILHSNVNWLIGLFFLATFAMANMESTLALLTENRMGYGIRETGYLFAFVGIMIAFTQGYLIRKLIPKWGEKKILLVGPFLTGAALLATAFITNTPQIMITMMFVALGSGISNPAILGSISKLTDAKEQGETMGVSQSISSLGRILGPACGGFLFSRVSPAMPYVVGGFVMFYATYMVFKKSGDLA